MSNKKEFGQDTFINQDLFNLKNSFVNYLWNFKHTVYTFHNINKGYLKNRLNLL